MLGLCRFHHFLSPEVRFVQKSGTKKDYGVAVQVELRTYHRQLELNGSRCSEVP